MEEIQMEMLEQKKVIALVVKILIALQFQCFDLHSQNIQGKFVTKADPAEHEVGIYEFFDDGSFRISSTKGNIDYTGTGKFEMFGDSIKFIFDNPQETPKSKIKLRKVADLKGRTLLSFTLKDNQNSFLGKFPIELKNGDQELVSILTANNGEGILSINNSNMPLWAVEIFQLGYERIGLSSENLEPGIWDINVTVYPELKQFISGNSQVFFVQLNERALTLINKENKLYLERKFK